MQLGLGTIALDYKLHNKAHKLPILLIRRERLYDVGCEIFNILHACNYCAPCWSSRGLIKSRAVILCCSWSQVRVTLKPSQLVLPVGGEPVAASSEWKGSPGSVFLGSPTGRNN